MLLHLRESVSIKLVCLHLRLFMPYEASFTHTHTPFSIFHAIGSLPWPTNSMAWSLLAWGVALCHLSFLHILDIAHIAGERRGFEFPSYTHMHTHMSIHMSPRMLLDTDSRLANRMPCAKEASVWALWHVSLWLLERGRLVSQVIPYRELEFPKRRERELASLFRLVKNGG